MKETGGSQAGLAYTSVGIAFATFVYIVLFHVYRRIRKTAVWKKIPKPNIEFCNKDKNDVQGKEDKMPMQDSETVQSPTTTIVELREPLLEK